MAQAPTAKHDEPVHHAPPKTVAEAPLVMPLAEAGPGKPLVGATSVIGEHLEDGERDPHTIAEEQRIRSAAYEAGLARDAPSGETRRVPPPADNHHASKK